MTREPEPGLNPATCVVYHGAGPRPLTPGKAFSWRPATELPGGAAALHLPALLLVDRDMRGIIAQLGSLPNHIVMVAADADAETALGDRALFSLVELDDERAMQRVLRAACALSSARLCAIRNGRQLARIRRELDRLRRIGMALMLERDRDALLHEIATQGKKLTSSDAVILLLLEPDPSGTPLLRPVLYEFDSLPEPPPLMSESLPLDHTSIIGHACLIQQPVVIDDAYELPPDAGFQRNPEFDKRFGYRIRSMLIVPMIDHCDALVGVLVFVNRKSDSGAAIRTKQDADRYVVQYRPRQVRLARALAGQAAVSIENARLHAHVEQILESFVKAAVSAIDQRDPTTAGHSMRVAALTTDLATAVERAGSGPYRDVCFSRAQLRELRFAALLHDFGKVGVHEDVLVKAKKLPPHLSERVGVRFDLIRRTLEVEYYSKRANLLRSGHPHSLMARLEAEFAAQLDQLQRLQSAVRIANEPTLEPEPPPADLLACAKLTFELPDGQTAPYLTSDELHYLSIPRGTLDPQERTEIESHVEQTYRYLMHIPWTDDLKNLPTYAYAHHEKLNGTGYPRRISGDQIPLQSRIMTIADIFDALTESDRPYKRAVSPEHALDIIQSEASAGQLDVDLVNILVASQVYRRILEEDWRSL